MKKEAKIAGLALVMSLHPVLRYRTVGLSLKDNKDSLDGLSHPRRVVDIQFESISSVREREIYWFFVIILHVVPVMAQKHSFFFDWQCEAVDVGNAIDASCAQLEELVVIVSLKPVDVVNQDVHS